MSDLVILNLRRITTVGTWANATFLHEFKTFVGTYEALNREMAAGWHPLPAKPTPTGNEIGGQP